MESGSAAMGGVTCHTDLFPLLLLLLDVLEVLLLVPRMIEFEEVIIMNCRVKEGRASNVKWSWLGGQFVL